MSKIVLLGSQHQQSTLASALKRVNARDPIATITCGWQEVESEEAEEIGARADRPIIQLKLHLRGDDVFQRDPEFFAAYRERQNELRKLQDLYRLRLGHALEASRELMWQNGKEELLEPERQDAIEAVRTLDQHHLRRMREVHERFDEQWRLGEREVIAGHRRELAEQLEEAGAVVVAGGHVAVLLYRLRLFDLAPLLEKKPIAAWSAGAMVLAEHIVLFHDNPPQGQGNPELLDNGLGLVRGVQPFPNARRRLRVEDPVRVALLARRFAPSTCAALNEDAELYYDEGRWTALPGTLRFSSSGKQIEFST
jgi:hypothetical protein